jgi:hypothetical protein
MLLGAGADARNSAGYTSVALAARNGFDAPAAMLRAAAARRAIEVAFAMGQHERLGGGPIWRALEP